MARGVGSSLGAALADLWRSGGRAGGARTSYHATTWKGQFTELSATQTGYAAMEAAGLSATLRTQRGWLSGEVRPTLANQQLIAKAYQAMRGGFDRGFTSATYSITGRVTIDNDSRERGQRGTAPLRIDGSRGRWDRIEDEWNHSADPERLEHLFVHDVVLKDLNFSKPPRFDGDDYEVTT